jgi:7-keto-8-aminopelargonate synthetase-like enzyme
MPPSSASPLPDLARLLDGHPTAWPATGLHCGRDFTRLDSLALAPVLDRRNLLNLPNAARVLSDRLAALLALPSVTLFRSGAEAIRHGLGHLIRAGDTVIVDAGSHGAIPHALQNIGARVCLAPPGSADGVDRRLTRLRGSVPGERLWVAVPAVSAHASVMSDLADLAALCQSHRARLVVDVTQDLGALAQGGGGVQEVQGCLGRADVVIGDFAPTFAGQGSFLALRDPGLLRLPLPGGDLLPDGQAQRLLAALGLIEGPEGRFRRRTLHGAVLRLRNQLLAEGVPVMGHPSPFVPVRLPPDLARQYADLAQKAGFDIPLLQAPLVAGRAPRWRIQVTAAHGLADIDDLAALVIDLCRLPRRPKAPARADALA